MTPNADGRLVVFGITDGADQMVDVDTVMNKLMFKVIW